jgi:ATP-binding cassette subfamily B protein
MQNSYSAWTIYRRVFQQIRPHWMGLTILVALNALAAPIALLMPVPLKIVVDNVLGSQPLPAFLQLTVPSALVNSPGSILGFAAALLIAVALLSQTLRLGSWILQEYLSEKLVLEFRSKLFAHVTQLSLVQHDRRGGSDLTYRIQYDAPAIRWLVMDGALSFFRASLTLFAMLYVIARLEPLIAAIALITIPAIVVLTRFYSPRLHENWRNVKILETGALSVVQEVLGAIRVVKAFGQESREQERLVQVSRRGLLERIRVIFNESTFNLLVGLTIAIGTAAVLLVGARAVRSGQLTTGDLVLLMAYVAQLYDPIQMMGKQLTAQQGSLTGAERTFAILDESPAVQERPNPKPLQRASGKIAFRDVGFSYRSPQNVLQGISFEIPAGTTVGLIGRTGAGKTTLLNLLTRFYDPTEGAIFLDDVDLRDYQLVDLRNQFSIVLQEPVLFPTTIAENIAYGVPNADEAAIMAAARLANAHDFISALPKGYETVVGDRGAMLSGGERQRISLARAFIKDSPLLILDEPTSSVDAATETAILEATLRLISNRTTFIIAHRQSTLRHCHMFLVLDKGRIVNVATGSDAGVEEQHEPTSGARPEPVSHHIGTT